MLNIALHSDVYEPILFKFDMTIDTAKLNSLIPVSITLTLTL